MITSSNPEDKSSEKKKISCMEMLQLILDGEATPEQHQAFKAHIDGCMPCFKNYNLDMAIKELVQCNCKDHAPTELIQAIRTQIESNQIL